MKIRNSVKKPSTKRRIRANEEIVDEEVVDAPIEDDVVDEGEVEVDPEATDLLFEAEDVAQLIAEVTGEDVAVSVDEDMVTFGVGEEEFVVEPEGDEEILETSRKALKGKKPVKASRTVKAARRGRALRRK